ncbi:unnamed protein product [Rangifer tarandus platyrhynchus]|uniref:Uncharacterized protein n=2 Tax=Rangifer tarandus platyrhynchus TaxID=3082113 RepID=A0AC59Y6F6_RANTA|nr:unnamed protein product [Rangifer tarandus platyrhynchus]
MCLFRAGTVSTLTSLECSFSPSSNRRCDGAPDTGQERVLCVLRRNSSSLTDLTSLSTLVFQDHHLSQEMSSFWQEVFLLAAGSQKLRRGRRRRGDRGLS